MHQISIKFDRLMSRFCKDFACYPDDAIIQKKWWTTDILKATLQ